MSKCLQMMLTLALFSVATQPAAAQETLRLTTTPHEYGWVHGNHDEIYEMAFYLSPKVTPVEGNELLRRETTCEVSFNITAKDATGVSSDVFDIEVDLLMGESQIVGINFGEFNEVGRSHLILTVTHPLVAGACVLFRTSALVDALTGRTVAIAKPAVINMSLGLDFGARDD